MNENELHERCIRLTFQYESAIDALLARGLVAEEAVSYTHLDVYKRQV